MSDSALAPRVSARRQESPSKTAVPEALAETVIERHRRRLRGRVRRITIDLDPADDLAHGGQQLALFNGFHGGHRYLPLLGFLSFDDEPEQ